MAFGTFLNAAGQIAGSSLIEMSLGHRDRRHHLLPARLIAFAKLQGIMVSARRSFFPGQHLLNAGYSASRLSS